jgi:two-component system, cell cycle response regulator
MAGAKPKTDRFPRVVVARVRPSALSLVAATPVLAAAWFAVEMARARLSGEAFTWPYVASLMAVLAATAAVVARRIRRAAHGSMPRLRDDLELGTLLLACACAPVPLFGESLFPLVYLVMAFLVAFFPRRAGLCLVGSAFAFDAILAVHQDNVRLTALLVHAAFLGLFAALYHGVLAAQLALNHAAEQAAVARRIREIEDRARAYRLASSGSQDRPDATEDREKWVFAAVKEIEGAVGAALEITTLALKTHTCAVFLLRSDDHDLQLHDCRSASERIQREPLAAGEGVLGAVLKRRAPVRMCGSVRGVTWYETRVPVKSVLAVPIVEGGERGSLRGVIVADRLVAAAFDDADERLLSTVAAEVLRSIEVERVMGYIKKARDEKDRFYRAIEELNRTSKLADVYGAAIDQARGIAELDFTAITVTDDTRGKRRHKVVRVAGVASGRALEGLEFVDNNGLVANVVRYGAPLPGRDVKQMDRPVVFDNRTALKGLSALKILPLKVGERVLGTLVAGSRKRHGLGEDAVRMLEVLGIQIAQSILRAQLFEQMEKMATTDGLTGLYNHRTFQVRLDELMAQARRYSRKLSLVVIDVDHFKQVNDKHGHPAGDQVLRGVAQMIAKQARDTDIVARYGGEEFAVVLPETDTKGAKVIAERIRVAVQGCGFDFETGPLKVTVSLGVATYPDVAKDKAGLVEKADQCLYYAKRHGRNRSVMVAEVEGSARVRLAAS